MGEIEVFSVSKQHPIDVNGLGYAAAPSLYYPVF
jgi:hypothetical protein